MDLPVAITELTGKRVGVAPGVESLRFGAEQCVQVAEAQAAHIGVVGRRDDAEPVDRDLQLDVADAVLLADRRLLVLDGARGIADVRLAGAEQGEAVAGAGSVDRSVDARVGRDEVLEDDRADRLDGRRTRDDDVPGDVAGAGSVAGAIGVAGAGCEDQRCPHHEGERGTRLPPGAR